MNFTPIKSILERERITLAGLLTQSPDLRLKVSDAIRRNPVHYVDVLFGVKLWRGEEGACGQADMLEAIFDHENTCIGSGHGTGKTYLSHVIPPIWLLSHCENLNSYVVITGASWLSVKNMIFPGVRKRMKEARIPIGPLPMAVEMKWSEGWQAVGMSPDNAEVAQGWHSSDGTLIFADEGSSLDDVVLDAYQSIMTDGDHIAIVGNPIRSEGPMAKILLQEQGTRGIWQPRFVSSYDTPNVRHPERPRIKGLATPDAIEKWLAKWPQGTPEFEARIMGRVPDQSDNVFIARSRLRDACLRKTIPWEQDRNLVLGIDVARSTVGDHTVFTVRGDHSLHLMEKRRGMTQDDVMNRLFEIRRDFAPDWMPPVEDEAERLRLEGILPERRENDWAHRYQEVMTRLHFALNQSRQGAIGVDAVFIDGTGMGSGYADVMDRLGYPATCRFVAAGSASNAQEMGNRRAEGYDALKKALQTLAIPAAYADEYAELCTLKYYFDGKGRMMIESKDDYKDRYKKSPDVSDSLAISYSRLPGEKAFAVALDARPLKLLAKPSVTFESRTLRTDKDAKEKRSWWLHIEGQPRTADTPGRLVRALWLASRESACIWAHIDPDGIWTILDALTEKGLPVRIFWESVLDRSAGHHYDYDQFAAPEDKERQRETHLATELWEVARARAGKGKAVAPVPSPTPVESLAGTAGLDTLHRLVLAQLSWFKDHKFWKDSGQDPLRFRRKEALGVWPDEVVDAIVRARLEERGWTDELTDDRPEALVAHGGALVRCLRLLAIKGAGG
jgi:hypothetical protein